MPLTTSSLTGGDQPLIKIYGSSDDLVEVEGNVPGCDEYNIEDATFILAGENGAHSRLRIFYNDNGCWEISVAPFDEDSAGLPVSISVDGYTAVAEFAATAVIREASGPNRQKGRY